MNGKVRFVDITSRDLLTLAIPSWVGRGGRLGVEGGDGGRSGGEWATPSKQCKLQMDKALAVKFGERIVSNMNPITKRSLRHHILSIRACQ